MTIKKFIDRPLLSIVINVMVVAVGIIALTRLPIEKFPDIAPPTVYLWASYPGASAETVQKSVVAPLEQAINGVDNMMYMTSSASNGSASISIYFKQGTNADMAAVNVQNRVVQAQAQLPAEVLRLGVAVEKQQPGQLRILALESPDGTYDENFLSNYFYNNLRPAILRIQGVGKCEVWGGQYALRIWLRPEAMARYGIVPSDITTLLEEQNVEASIGSIGENTTGTFQYTLRYTGRKQDVTEFENLILRSNRMGEELRLKDVADLELGQSDYAYSNRINGHPGVMGSVSQVAGSNATRINQDIDKLLEEVEQTMPKDIRVVTFDNTNDFLFASIRDVVFTLLLAIVLVLIVVYLFVQDFRATLILALGIIVSLIGTFAFMAVAGFSINMLTLFALVLVIGTVVDDSIVVVEAVQARFDAGYRSAYKASVDAMNGLTSALFTTTLVFMVIFIPVSFVSGTSGTFYKQFGLTDEARSIWQIAVEEGAATPMTYYYLFAFCGEQEALEKAEEADSAYCFPNRPEDVICLEAAKACAAQIVNSKSSNCKFSKAPYYLGCLYYAARQYDLAIENWERSAELDPTFPTVWRNLALGRFNKQNKQQEALEYMERAFHLDENDERVLMELDQLYKHLHHPHAERLAFLQKYPELIRRRDDLVLEEITLLNQVGRYEEAMQKHDARTFHPWEGGEGKVPTQYQICRVELVKKAIAAKEYEKAIQLLNECLEYPHHLGEGKLYGAQENDFYYLLGIAYDALGQKEKARQCWEEATKGPQEPAAAMYYNDAKPDKIFYQGLALLKLGREAQAHGRFYRLINYGKQHVFEKQLMDYFAVSLPDLLIWEDSLDTKNLIHCKYMLALGYYGLGDREHAERYLKEVEEQDNNHQGIQQFRTLVDAGL